MEFRSSTHMFLIIVPPAKMQGAGRTHRPMQAKRATAAAPSDGGRTQPIGNGYEPIGIRKRVKRFVVSIVVPTPTN